MNITPTITLCRCGHHADHHEHYRAGTDCSLCSCPSAVLLTLGSVPSAWWNTRHVRAPLLAGLVTAALFVGFKVITAGVLSALGYLP